MSSSQPIQTLLSSLRAPIFQSAHNPTSARTGAKYLKRRLRGPSALAYYPRPLDYAALNAEKPWSPFANWRGEPSGQFKRRVLAGKTTEDVEREKVEAREAKRSEAKAEDAQKKGEAEAGAGAGAEGSSEGEASTAATAAAEGKAGEADAADEVDGRMTKIWRCQSDQLPASQVVPQGWVEVTRLPGAGWVADGRERVRAEEVGLRRAAGRGPPKKGEGKRSQLKKK